MTHVAADPSRGIPRGWLLPVGAVVLVLMLVAVGVFSTAMFIDFLAWWPVWIALGATGYFTRGRQVGKLNLNAVVPIVGLVVVGLFVWGYLAGWALMPSASTRLNGPLEGPAISAALSATIDGQVEVSTSDLGFVYSVVPKRGGGQVGLPEANEKTQGSALGIVLTSIEDPGLNTFSGWEIGLSTLPVWSITLGGDVEADLADLVVGQLNLEGTGEVDLGTPIADATVTVSGGFKVSVPVGVAVTVTGDATVPEGWTQTAGGWSSPGSGPGWIVAVLGGSALTVEES